jgi:hypothetical protein
MARTEREQLGKRGTALADWFTFVLLGATSTGLLLLIGQASINAGDLSSGAVWALVGVTLLIATPLLIRRLRVVHARRARRKGRKRPVDDSLGANLRAWVTLALILGLFLLSGDRRLRNTPVDAVELIAWALLCSLAIAVGVSTVTDRRGAAPSESSMPDGPPIDGEILGPVPPELAQNDQDGNANIR